MREERRSRMLEMELVRTGKAVSEQVEKSLIVWEEVDEMWLSLCMHLKERLCRNIKDRLIWNYGMMKTIFRSCLGEILTVNNKKKLM